MTAGTGPHPRISLACKAYTARPAMLQNVASQHCCYCAQLRRLASLADSSCQDVILTSCCPCAQQCLLLLAVARARAVCCNLSWGSTSVLPAILRTLLPAVAPVTPSRAAHALLLLPSLLLLLLLFLLLLLLLLLPVLLFLAETQLCQVLLCHQVPEPTKQAATESLVGGWAAQ